MAVGVAVLVQNEMIGGMDVVAAREIRRVGEGAVFIWCSRDAPNTSGHATHRAVRDADLRGVIWTRKMPLDPDADGDAVCYVAFKAAAINYDAPNLSCIAIRDVASK